MTDFKQPWEDLVAFAGHSSWVYGAEITPDNKSLLSVDGSRIVFWDLDSLEVKDVFQGHTDTIFALDLSPDSKILASGSIDKTVCLWNLEDRAQICTLAQRKDPIHSVAFSSDGKLLAAGGENKYKADDGKKTTIYLWNVEKRELVNTLVGHDLRVNSVAFSPDGKVLASASNDSTVRLWNIESGKQIYVLEGHPDKVSTVLFTTNGQELITAGAEGIKVWDVRTFKLNHSFAQQTEYILCFAIHPQNKFLACGAYEEIEIWDYGSSEKLKTLEFQWPTSINFSPDGSLLVSGDASAFANDEGGLVRIWKVPNVESETNPDDIEVVDPLHATYLVLEQKEYFNPQNLEDARERITTSIVQRRGQAGFRKELLEAYNYCCSITGCNVEPALEAAHIVPYKGTETNHITNGLLLRADVHTLFDLHLISIEPNTYKVKISSELLDTDYEQLNQKAISLPKDKASWPSQHALEHHYQIFGQETNVA